MVLQRIVDWSQQQRQRRAEFVADIAEELRLGAIQFRQHVGAQALFLCGARWRMALAVWVAISSRKPR
jgi:hypothetical protein